MSKKQLEKSDLHIHLDEGANFEKKMIVDILQRAEKNNVKNLSFVKFDRIDQYSENNELYKMHKSGELKKHYSGKIVTGVERICRIEGTKTSKSGFNHNGYVSHMLMYDFDPKKLVKNKYFNAKKQEKLWFNDIKTLLENGRKFGLTVPPLSDFYYEMGHFTPYFYEYISKHADSNPINKKIIEKYPTKSSFSRNAVESPGGELHFKKTQYPSIQSMKKAAKKSGAKLVLAHPEKHNDLFDGIEYIDAVREIIPNDLWGIEGQYMLNSKSETKKIKDYAKELGLEVTGGSDFRYYVSEKNPEGKMYFIDNGETVYYIPQPSFLIKESADGEKEPFVMLEKDMLDKLKDFREYYKD